MSFRLKKIKERARMIRFYMKNIELYVIANVGNRLILGIKCESSANGTSMVLQKQVRRSYSPYSPFNIYEIFINMNISDVGIFRIFSQFWHKKFVAALGILC